MVASKEGDWRDGHSAVELLDLALKRISILCTMTSHDPLFHIVLAPSEHIRGYLF